MIKIYNGDCLEVMSRFKDKSFDAIITDPPYGITKHKWDSVIPFSKHLVLNNKIVYENEFILHQVKHGMSYDKAKIIFNTKAKNGMWEQLKRIIKPNGAIVLFGSEPFSSALRMSNIKNYKYDWVWNKKKPGNVFAAKKQPMKTHENILVFGAKSPSYYPIMVKRGKAKKYKNYGTGVIMGGTKEKEEKICVYTHYYPKSILEFNNAKQIGKVHPTQKPVALMEYLIKTYINEGETVLDFTMGSGTTLVACKRTNRNGIGIEQDKKYCEIAIERLKNENLME